MLECQRCHSLVSEAFESLPCPQCGHVSPSVLSRRQLLIHSGQLGVALAGLGVILSACDPNVTALPTPTRNPYGIQWSLANPYGIQIPPPTQAEQSPGWLSGHVDAILPLSGGALVASHTGGVWYVSDNDTQTLPLSDNWVDTDIRCLAQGPDTVTHYYAGGFSGSYAQSLQGSQVQQGALYVAVSRDVGILGLNWDPIPLVADTGQPIGGIRSIAVLREQRRVVLATTNGLYWSDIPAYSRGAGYTWHVAQIPYVALGDCWSVTVAAKNDQARTPTIVAGATGADSIRGSTIYCGTFDTVSGATILNMIRARVTGLMDPIQTTQAASVSIMRTTTVAACRGQPQTVYAVVADVQNEGAAETPPTIKTGFMLDVLASTDGGQTWQAKNARLAGGTRRDLRLLASWQGVDWNNCLGVDPSNAQQLAFGFVNGPLLSQDGGVTFQQAPTSQTQAHPPLHQDFHAISFVDSRTWYVGSDGGIAVTRDGANTFQSLNHRLADLECLGPSARQWWGSLAASSIVPGLLTMGLQDNGNVSAVITDDTGSTTPWQQIEAGDGGPMFFLPSDFLSELRDARHELAIGYSGSATPGGSVYSSYTFIDGRVAGAYAIPIRTPGSSTRAGDPMHGGVLQLTTGRRATVSGLPLYGVLANGNELYGLFLTGDFPAIRAYWDFLTTLSEASPAQIGTLTGNRIVVAMRNTGNIFVLTPSNLSNPAVSNCGFPPGIAANFLRIIVTRDDDRLDAWVAGNYQSPRGDKGRLYRTTGTTSGTGPPVWSQVTGGFLDAEPPVYCLEWDGAAPPNARVFVGTDHEVYASSNGLTPWTNVSNGLPKGVHCSDLRFVRYADGSQHLYLSTWGRSVWRTRLS